LHHLLTIVHLGRVQSIQVAHVSSQLLDGASAECVAGSNQHLEVVLNQPEADLNEPRFNLVCLKEVQKQYLGEIGGLSNSVHTAESHDEGTSLAF
jgi:hypothetical protein